MSPIDSDNIRPGWDDYFLGIASAVSARGECVRSRVGAVLVTKRQIVSTGYNGVMAGERSCLDGACPRALNDVERGTLYEGPGSCIAIHAEVNCLTNATDRGIIVEPGSTLYLTKEPCERCAEYLQPFNLRVVWKDETR
jgi:dCMP deaminase